MRLARILLFTLLFCGYGLPKPPETHKVADIEVVGNFDLPAKELLRFFPVKPGQEIDPNALRRAAGLLQRQLQANGYLYAHIDSVKLERGGQNNGARIFIYGASGRLVKFGAIKVVADSLSPEEYQSELGIPAGEPFAKNRIDEGIQRILRLAADKGFPFAEASIDSARIINRKGQFSVAVKIAVHEHQPVFIKDILIRGNTYTKDRVILRELDLFPGMRYSERKIAKVVEQLNRLNIFKSVNEPEILKVSPDSVLIRIDVEEGNATLFNGVVGYIPETAKTALGKSGGYFTGLIDLAFRNLFGTGRKFMVHWKKADRYSEDFNFSYSEPWVFNFPVDLGLGLNRVVRDTTYIEWQNFIRGELRFFGHLKAILSVRKKTIIPDSAASHDLRLPLSDVWSGEAGIVYDTRDDLLNPRRGLYFRNSYSWGVKKITGPGYLIREDSLTTRDVLQSVALDVEGYLPLWRNQVAAVGAHIRQIKGKQLSLGDYFWFGGSRTLRGYRENQFSAPLISWVNLEYRFLLNKNSRVFLFNDWGYYQQRSPAELKELLYGYGLGIRLETPLGILGVDYGLGKGDSFSRGKIHFGLVNTF